MRTLIVGLGALGGTIATRAIAAGIPVWLATRDEESARKLRAKGLHVSGVGGEAAATSARIAPIESYANGEKFDLILLATKAHDALEVAPFLARLLFPSGSLLCIQNGGVSQSLSERASGVVLGGLSNLGATMVEPGVYQQSNAGHLLIGEVRGGVSDRARDVAAALSPAIEMRVTANLPGAIWAKLLLNCSVTTIGALANRTMREYMTLPAGREVFHRVYDETLAVALANGTRPERMIVDPIPPQGPRDEWVDRIVATYGDIKPSMLQDFERGRRTEIDFINGFVSQLGTKLGVPVAMNAAITGMAHRIEQGGPRPDPARLDDLLRIVQSFTALPDGGTRRLH
ncbi:MAG: ketopantoate reductase family protein [Myxococcales bacterium]